MSRPFVEGFRFTALLVIAIFTEAGASWTLRVAHASEDQTRIACIEGRANPDVHKLCVTKGWDR